MMLALSVGLLLGGATFLMLQRDRFRVILGFVILSHGVNLLLFATGGTLQRAEPIGGDLDPSATADPLPQAFVLTAIVISFAITIYMLVLAVTGKADPPEDDHGARLPRSEDDPAATSDESAATTDDGPGATGDADRAAAPRTDQDIEGGTDAAGPGEHPEEEVSPR
ncbi:MAG TPA: NADH-quinone oxidoreductase subunit K [Candidatus Brachybacterium merdigallinarum]|nr:NADH-quinone oxidoreductase subunit K [Candidatus Brachybacterium merdigallinarum]